MSAATPAMLAAVNAAVRPPRAPKPVRVDPERAAAGKPTRIPRSHTSAAPDNSRVSLVELDASGGIVLHVPARAARDGTADSTLKLAQSAAPGVSVKVARGRRVLAEVAASTVVASPPVIVVPAPAPTPPDTGKPASPPGKPG